MTTRVRSAAAILMGTVLSACTSAALQTVNTPSYLKSELQAERGISYGALSHQKLDLYLPPADTGRQQQLVVFVYGGGWTSGSRKDYYFVADALTAQGYAVAIPDYIQYPQGAFPEFVNDVALAMSWLADESQSYAPAERFILIGHSAGAHTAALLFTDESYLSRHGVEVDSIDAFIGLAGPYGFTPETAKYQNVFANLDDYNQMRPLHFADGDEPPMLLIHGNDDSTVLPVNTKRFAEKISNGGGQVTARYYDDVGHVEPVLALSRTPLQNTAIRDAIMDFLQQLKSSPTKSQASVAGESY